MARPVQSKRLKYSREVKLTGCEAFAGESLNCTRCLAFPVILALTEVWAESRGVVAIPALTGFKSTYVMHFNRARSSSSASIAAAAAEFGVGWHTANQAVAAARLGAGTRFVGRVGRDGFGEQVLQIVSGEGVNMDAVAIDDENGTGLAVIALVAFAGMLVWMLVMPATEAEPDASELETTESAPTAAAAMRVASAGSPAPAAPSEVAVDAPAATPVLDVDLFAGPMPDFMAEAHMRTLDKKWLHVSVQKKLYEYGQEHKDDARPQLSDTGRTTVFDTSFSVSSFGEDENGELYIASLFTGAIYKLVLTNPDPENCEPDLPGCNAAALAEPFGEIDVFDLLAFIDAYTNQDAAADLAEPFGEIDVFDLLEYLDQYSAGCPE